VIRTIAEYQEMVGPMSACAVDRLATQCDLYLRRTPGTQALSAWSMTLARNARLDEMDRTWPIVRARLERAEFERSL
jgi:hypothetical protein